MEEERKKSSEELTSKLEEERKRSDKQLETKLEEERKRRKKELEDNIQEERKRGKEELEAELQKVKEQQSKDRREVDSKMELFTTRLRLLEMKYACRSAVLLKSLKHGDKLPREVRLDRVVP
eukprot:Colp12_sorted_trinity150504_noHs@25741